MKNESAPKFQWKYLFLTVSLAGAAIAAFDHEPTRVSYLSAPVSAILFGLFLIWTVLGKESALYDEQNRLAPAAAKPVPVRWHEPRRPVNDVSHPILSARLH